MITNWRDVAVGIVLLASTRDGDEEEQNPRNANLGPHFKVDATDTRVQACAPR